MHEYYIKVDVWQCMGEGEGKKKGGQGGKRGGVDGGGKGWRQRKVVARR